MQKGLKRGSNGAEIGIMLELPEAPWILAACVGTGTTHGKYLELVRTAYAWLSSVAAL
jgi:hypothetical protein